MRAEQLRVPSLNLKPNTLYPKRYTLNTQHLNYLCRWRRGRWGVATRRRGRPQAKP